MNCTDKIIHKSKHFTFLKLIFLTIVYSAAGDLVITEYYYKSNQSFYEYIEIYNTTDLNIVLNGYKLIVGEIEYEINSATEPIPRELTILANDFVVFTGLGGRFENQGGEIFLSPNDPNWFNSGSQTIDLNGNFYWFDFLLGESDVIAIKDPNDIIIDEISFSLENNFPVLDTDVGQSIEYVLDCNDTEAHLYNDDGRNWQIHDVIDPNGIMLDSENPFYGTPAKANFIIANIYDISSAELDGIIRPNPDGIPGGYANVIFDASNNTEDIIEYKWLISNENWDTVYTTNLGAQTFQVYKDVDPESDQYLISVIIKNDSGIMGKRDTIIEVSEENNIAPTVHAQTIYAFEESLVNLNGIVTDPEICSEIDMPCGDHFSASGATFLWETLDPLEPNFTILNPTDMDTRFDYHNIISASGDQTANNITNTLKFLFTARDPFSYYHSDTVTVIIKNYNSPPQIEIPNIDKSIYAGYPFELDIYEDSLKLLLLDTAGELLYNIYLGEITDLDGDASFTIKYNNNDVCNESLDLSNNYCISNNRILTRSSNTNTLSIPFYISDGVSFPNEEIQTTATLEEQENYDRSLVKYLDFSDIVGLNNFDINFDIDIDVDNDGNHLIPEDISDLSFYLEIKDVNTGGMINFNDSTLEWIFNSKKYSELDVINATRVPLDTINSIISFKIDSIENNWNGDPEFVISVSNNESDQNLTILESIVFDIPFLIDQRNDIPYDFNIKPDLYAYDDIDTTTFFNSSDSLFFFRLPQDDNQETIDNPRPLRFAWEKNELIDIDADPNLNEDPLSIYYRLELYDTSSYTVYILKNDINHDDPFDDIMVSDGIFSVDINFIDSNGEHVEFNWYDSNLGYKSYSSNNPKSIESNGFTTYQWRVIAQNYEEDNLNQDPLGISNGWEASNFNIDLLKPSLSSFNVLFNPYYPGFYDLIFGSNGQWLLDSTAVNIVENILVGTDIIPIKTHYNLHPRAIDDYKYHIASIINPEIDIGLYNYEISIRDLAMNKGQETKMLNYISISKNIASSFNSSSGMFSISFKEESIDSDMHIFVVEEENISSSFNSVSLSQITPLVTIFAKNDVLNKPVKIQFNIEPYLISGLDIHKYQIVNIIDGSYDILNTNHHSDGLISSESYNLGSYAVFMNYDDKLITSPKEFSINLPYPNPFNSTISIPLEIPEGSIIKVMIINLLGDRVRLLQNSFQSKGYTEIVWDGKDDNGLEVSSGIYLLTLEYNKIFYSKKMMLLK